MSDNDIKAIPRQLLEIAGHISREHLAALPRIIDPGDVEYGQWIAFSNHNDPNDWHVELFRGEKFSADYKGTIVLLADAPEEEPEQLHRVGGPEWRAMVKKVTRTDQDFCSHCQKPHPS